MRRKIGILIVLHLVFLATWGIVALRAAGPPKEAKFVGTKKCRSCHLKEYNTWRKTGHAKTYAHLEGPETKDPDCLKCHTTGYGKPGGFVDIDKTPALVGTGCESCHGPGSVHAEAAKDAPEDAKWDTKIDKVPQNTCVDCHNPHVPQKARVEKLRAERKS